MSTGASLAKDGHARTRKPWTLAIGIVSLALLLYMAYLMYSMVTGKDRMTLVCSQIKPGMPVDQLVKLAEEHGLGPRTLRSDTTLAFLAESRSFGRHACRVELDAGIVKNVTYNFAD